MILTTKFREETTMHELSTSKLTSQAVTRYKEPAYVELDMSSKKHYKCLTSSQTLPNIAVVANLEIYHLFRSSKQSKDMAWGMMTDPKFQTSSLTQGIA